VDQGRRQTAFSLGGEERNREEAGTGKRVVTLSLTVMSYLSEKLLLQGSPEPCV
jgi:hypothetical protein